MQLNLSIALACAPYARGPVSVNVLTTLEAVRLACWRSTTEHASACDEDRKSRTPAFPSYPSNAAMQELATFENVRRHQAALPIPPQPPTQHGLHLKSVPRYFRCCIGSAGCLPAGRASALLGAVARLRPAPSRRVDRSTNKAHTSVLTHSSARADTRNSQTRACAHAHTLPLAPHLTVLRDKAPPQPQPGICSFICVG